MDYKELLKISWEQDQTGGFWEPSTSKLVFISEFIFNFTTYESDAGELFARKALEVCAAISHKKTFEYIKSSKENNYWYLMMCNTEFFISKIEWSTSIRGAWWDNKIDFTSCGLFDRAGQVTEISFNNEDWVKFLDAVIEFSKPE